MQMGEADWSDMLSKSVTAGIDAWGKVYAAKSQVDIAKAQAKAQAANPFANLFGAPGSITGAGAYPVGAYPVGAGQYPTRRALDGGNTVAYMVIGGAALLGILMLTVGGRRK